MHISAYLVARHGVFKAWHAYFYIYGRMSWGFRGMGCIFRYICWHVTVFLRDVVHISIYFVAFHGGPGGGEYIFLYIWSHVTGFSRHGMHISIYLVVCHGVLEAWVAYFCIFGRKSWGYRGMGCMLGRMSRGFPGM